MITVTAPPEVLRGVAARLLASVEKDALASDPLKLLHDGQLYIQDKQAALRPLVLNSCQQQILQTVQRLQQEGKPLRLLVLKCRQSGVSTLIEALLYCRTSQQPNRNALILADQEKKSAHLYDMTRRFQEHLARVAPSLAPTLERCNDRALKFAALDSRVMIGSAENPNLARSFTWQDAHLSEVAHYPPNRVAELFDGFWPSVAKGSHSLVVLETTANGHDPIFYPLWMAAQAGQNDFTPIFIPWFAMTEYAKPVVGESWYPLSQVVFDTDGGLDDFLQEERWLVKEFGLTAAQLNWRRWCIVNECRGELSIFRQEYPATWQEAFQVSGTCVFRTAVLRVEQAAAEKALPRLGRLVEFGDRVEFRDDPQGWLRLYEPPKGQQVRIGGDTCEGLPWGEEAGLVVGDALSRNVLATVSYPCPPDVLARHAALLGRFYTHPQLGEPLIAIEANGYGHTANQVLRTIYGRVYSTKHHDPDTRQEVERFGFLTTGPSRDQLIDVGKARIREHAAALRDLKLIGQCFSFVRDPKTGKVGHTHGAFDDLVLSWLIMLWLCDRFPAEHLGSVYAQSSEGQYAAAMSELSENAGVRF